MSGGEFIPYQDNNTQRYQKKQASRHITNWQVPSG
jgi:hypothetical protein